MSFINRWSDCMDAPDNSPIYAGDPSNEMWMTEDNRLLRVGDMTDNHVRNCYKMVMRTYSVAWQRIFKAEMDKRGITAME